MSLASELNILKQKKITSSSSKLLETLPEKKQRTQEELTFSFRFFERKHSLFNLGGIEDNWFIDLFIFLENISKLRWIEVTTTHKSIYDPHDYSGKCNADINDILKAHFKENFNQFDCFQIRLSKGKGRVHGFLVGNVYYIIWLDPNHNMYDSDGYPKAQKTPQLQSEYERLQSENTKLIKEVKEINEAFTEICNNTCPHIIKK